MEEKAREISEQILTQRGGNVIFDEENRAVLIFDGEKLWTSKIIFILDSVGWSSSENGIRGPWKDLQVNHLPPEEMGLW